MCNIVNLGGPGDEATWTLFFETTVIGMVGRHVKVIKNEVLFSKELDFLLFLTI